MNEFKKVSLQDFVTLQRGFDLPSHQRTPGNVPVVASTGISSWHNEAKVKAPGVVIGRSGSIGGGQFLEQDFWPLNTTLYVKDFKGNNPRFAYYVLKLIDFSAFNAGAGVPTLNRNHIASIEVISFERGIQDRIASVLAHYDSAIANCRRQIALLEEAAMRLYKECFKDGKGEKKKIGEVCECVLGGTPNRAKPEYWGGNVAWINSGKVNELRIVEPSEYITELGLRKSAAKMMPRHTTVLAITGATLGQVSLLEIDSAANQSVVGVLENENLHYEFIYPLIVDNIRKLIMHQTGGAQQHICKDDVLNFEVHIPNKGELKKYGELARPMFEQISELFFTIRALAEARDRLLPKLMKGEIAV